MTTRAQDADVASRLLAFLRERLGARALTYADAPASLQGGFDTQIYGFRLHGAPDHLAGRLILRVFRSRDNPERARWEATVHGALTDMGYPAPRVLLTCTDPDILGGAFVIMERLPGSMMLEEIFKPTKIRLRKIFGEVPRVLAQTQEHLHGLDPRPLLQAIDAAGLSTGIGPAGAGRRQASAEGQLSDIRDRVERTNLHGLRSGVDWLVAHRPRDPERPVICHGDFHPLNLLMEHGIVTGVLDWPMVTIADPAFDVGNTKLLLGQAPVPGFLDWLASAVRSALARRYYHAYLERRPVDDETVRYYEAQRCLVELSTLAEIRKYEPEQFAFDPSVNPWNTKRATGRLISHFKKISGVRVVLSTTP